MAIPVYPGKPLFPAKFQHKYAVLSARKCFSLPVAPLVNNILGEQVLGVRLREHTGEIRQIADGKRKLLIANGKRNLFAYSTLYSRKKILT